MSNEALTISDIGFSVTSQIKRAPHWTMIRELTMNAVEAASKSQKEKIVHWTIGTYQAVQKAVIWNTGPGMSAAELKAATDLSCQVNKQLDLDENFGVGAKVSSLGSNQLGMQFRSCKAGRVSQVIVGYDTDTEQFVRFEMQLASGQSDTVIDVTSAAVNEGRKVDQDWTEVMLLGNSPGQDTSQKPFESQQTEKAYIATALYRRFYRLPAGVKIKLDSVYQRLDGTRPFTPLGERYEKFERVETVDVPDLNMKIHYLHDPAVGDKSGLRKSSSGALGSSTTTCALIHKNEMYSVMTGPEWSAAAPRFGIPFGSKEICIHIELGDDEARPTQYRERLISKSSGDDIVPEDFAFAVIERMPDWLREVIRNASPKRSENFNDLQDELRDLLNKYKVKIKGRRIDAADGDKSSVGDKTDGVAVGENGKGGGGGGSVRGPRKHVHSAPDGATTTTLYDVLENPPKITMLETLEDVIDKNLKGRAAGFIAETGDLFVNGLYEAVDRTIQDIEPEFANHDDQETVRGAVLIASRRALAFRVGKAVVFALAKRANEDWGVEALNAALSKESLSIAADDYDESLSSVRRHVKEQLKIKQVAA